MLACEQEKSICVEEHFLYGSDLLYYRLIPYRGKLKSVVGTEDIASNAYILIDTKRKHDICRVPVNILENRIYIAEGNFNRYWKNISYSIYAAWKKEKALKEDFYSMQKEIEAYVDLSFYANEHRKALIENCQIKIEGIPLSAEQQKLRSRRASAMDNKKLVYVFSDDNDIVHDKSCPLIKNIADADFRAAAELPEGRVLCTECKRRMYIRRGCGDDFKCYDAYSYFFKKGHVNTETIGALTGTYQAKMRLEGRDMLTVSCGEDTWKIGFGERDHIILWHNNYTMISDTERYICGGFHRQNVSEHISMTGAIRYIESYTWEKHLAAKKHPAGQEDVLETECGENLGAVTPREMECSRNLETEHRENPDKVPCKEDKTGQKENVIEEKIEQRKHGLRMLWVKVKEGIESFFRKD